MESSFGHDFSRVRVHSGPEASSMAQRMQARAYTVGHDVVLGPGEAVTGSAGRTLLAHELAHVIQYDLSGRAVLARQTPPGAPAPVRAVSHYEETLLPGGRVRIRAWGRVGDPIDRPGLEKKFPEPGKAGLPGYDRWHLAGPNATGAEEGIAYAPKNFNVGKTAEVENVIRRARTAAQEQGGEVFFDFEAECRIVGEYEGVSIRVVENARWQAEVRAAGSDRLVTILNERAAVSAVPHPQAIPKVAPTPAVPPAHEAEVTPAGPKVKPAAPAAGVAEAASREAAVVPLRTRIKVGIKGVAIELLWIGILLGWSYLMDKLSQKIEASVVEWQVKSKLADLEPQIQARLDNQASSLAAVQLANPGRPAYGNISVLIHEYRMFDDDEETLVGLTVELTDVTIAAAPQKAQSRERYYTGHKWLNYAPHDLIRVTFPMELQPLSRDTLRAFLDQRISELEKAESVRSSTPEAAVASQRERDRLAEQRRGLDQP
jgi:hypothetical protein